MPEEDLDRRDEFLLQNGKRVHEVREVQVGDILGVASPETEDVRLSYVDYVSLKPDFIKFDYFPYAKLKGPFFGFYISEKIELEGFKYLSLNPVHSTGRFWKPQVISQELSPEQQETQREFLEKFPDKNERAYVISEGQYKELGNLIPLIELPSLSFLPQSRDLEELVKMIKDSIGDIGAMRTVAQNLERIYKGL